MKLFQFIYKSALKKI